MIFEVLDPGANNVEQEIVPDRRLLFTVFWRDYVLYT